MNWKTSPPAIEIASAALSVASLGGATCFAVMRIAPPGAGWIAAGAAGACAALAGGWLIARVDRAPVARAYHPPVAALDRAAFADEILLLEDRVEAEVLVLDDPVRDAEPPRVVQLFTAAPGDEAVPPPLTGPGEMIARIEHFLGHARGGPIAEAPVPGQPTLNRDANAALHAALADIRRSLRQG